MEPLSPIDEGNGKAEETSLLKQAFLAIQQMQAKLEASERRTREPIAVVGLGCRFPGGVVNGETFWNSLREGRDAISPVPLDRWNADAYYHSDPEQPGKAVTRQGGFLDQVDKFDAGFFEIAPREAASMDPQQRLALEVAWEALENAGYAPTSLRGTKAGVFLGIASGDYSQLQLQAGDLDLLNAHYASGIAHSIASGRISYVLGLEGPSVSLDTACSSSLVAVHLACQSLRAGDCGLALAGGVNVMLAPETTALLSRVRMLAPDGRCKAFDESADGFARGEGCGFVVLKTLSQAQADGDRILALVRGSAVNQDGASSSLTAPNGPSQVNLMRQAIANAGVQPRQITYVEAHGTGTALGDPIELQALGAVYGASRPKGDLLTVGSLKTNIGHLEAAAGVAGLIKTVLAVQHRQIPPHLHLKRPTSHVRWDDLRLAVPLKLTAWETAPGAAEDTRVAAVSSFGFSGTNAHVIVAEASPSNSARSETGWPLQILTASAKSKTALMRVVGQYCEYIEKHPAVDLRDFCFTANTGRSHFQHRACFVAPDAEAMGQQLAAFEVPAERASKDARRTVFLFTGQGSQYGGMGRELYESAPVFREAVERCATAWKEERGESLIAVLYPAEGEASRMGEARYAQPALFAFEYALAELWRSWGVEPSVLLGHSLGEYVAAVVGGVFSLQDGLRLVCARARLMDRLTVPGAMRAIGASAERVEAEIQGLEKEVSIAAVNGPESVVLSGAAETVARIARKLEAEGIRTRPLEVTHAFHSPLLEPILEEFEACARQVTYHAPRIRIISNLTGKTARAEEIATPRYWRQHMRQAVLFHAGLQTALETGCDAFIEIGPQPHLLSLAKSAYSSPDLLWLPSTRKGRSAWLDLLAAVQSLYGLGAEINWKALHGKSGRLITLPSYPFERQRHWFPQLNSSQKNAAKMSTAATHSTQGHPLLGLRLHSPLAEIQFASRIDPDQPAYLGDYVVAGQRVVPAAAYLEMALSASHIVTGESRAIRAATFLRPCIFDEPRILQLVLQAKGSGSSFEIYSCAEVPVGSKSDWVLHASGEMVARISSEEPGEALDAIRKRCAGESDVAGFYRMFEEHDLFFGASFRPVSRILSGPDEALVEFEFLSEVSADARLYQIHPIALDACIQAVAAAVMSSDDRGAFSLPAALEELHLNGDPRKLTVAHAKVRGGDGEPLTADVQGFDQSGNVLVSATGLVLRSLGQVRQEAPEADSISDSFYEVEWTPMERQALGAAALNAGIQGASVLFGGGNMIRSLSAALIANGVPCMTIQQGEGRADLSTNDVDLQISFDSAEPHCYETLLNAIREQTATLISDVVYAAPPEIVDVFHLRPDRLMELEAGTLGEALQIVQTLVRMGLEKAPRLWLITKGAQGPSLSNVSQSTLWGFGRAVALEHPDMRVVRIDLDPSRDMDGQELLQCMMAAGPEDELVLRGREIYVPRLRPAAQLKHRYLAQARHIGKDVICPEKATEAGGIRKDGAYLVTGGLSGLGLAVAEWLARCGAAQVIVIGRRLPGKDAAEIFRNMRAAGTLVTVCQGDVANQAELSATVHCAERFPLRGVFHCAAVLDDGSLLQLDWDRFRRVLAPKLEGVCNLHRLTADSPLDHFVLFSSIASVLGSRGQTNYASANAFLDAMAQYRRSRGLPALSINWGAWSETGAAVRHNVVERGSQIGLRGISTLDGLRALEMLKADTRAQVVVAPVDWSTWFASSGSESNQQLLSELRTGRKIQIPEKAAEQKNPSWLPQLEAAAPARRQSLLLQLLEERVQITLGLGRAQEIAPDQPLQELGLDSLLSIELRNSLSTSLRRGLPATLLFNYPTLDALAGYILQNFFVYTKPAAVKQNTDPAQRSLVDDIEALSDEEVDRLLSVRAMGGVQ